MCAHASRKGSQRVRFTFADKLSISRADLCIEFRDATQLRNYDLHGHWHRSPLAACFQTNTATPIVAASITRASKREPE